jgi:hypothetical protein
MLGLQRVGGRAFFLGERDGLPAPSRPRIASMSADPADGIRSGSAATALPELPPWRPAVSAIAPTAGISLSCGK